MSSEQSWSSTPPDLAESQSQYADPYQAQPYAYGGAPQDPSQSQGYAAGNGYGYAGYGDTYGYVGDGGYAGTGGYAADGGYGGGNAAGGAQGYAGYDQYGQSGQYGQYAEYQQYEQPGQPYAQAYEDPYAQSYPQTYADPYAEPGYVEPGYVEPGVASPQPAPPSAAEYPGWDEPDQDGGHAYAEDALSRSQDRLRAPERQDWPDDGPSGTSGPSGRSEPAAEGSKGPTGPRADEEPKPKRRGRFVAGVVVLIVIAGGGAAYKFLGASKSNGVAGAPANSTANAGAAAGGGATGSASASGSASSPQPTAAASVTIPASAGGLTQMTNKVGQAGVSAMQKSASGSADLANAQFASYEKTGSSTFFGNLTLAQLSKAPDIQKTYTLTGAAATLKALGATSLTDEQSITPGIAGSAMACGEFSTGGNTLSLCIWVDPSEFGLFAGPKALTDAQAEQYAEAIETASEH